MGYRQRFGERNSNIAFASSIGLMALAHFAWILRSKGHFAFRRLLHILLLSSGFSTQSEQEPSKRGDPSPRDDRALVSDDDVREPVPGQGGLDGRAARQSGNQVGRGEAVVGGGRVHGLRSRSRHDGDLAVPPFTTIDIGVVNFTTAS